MQVSPESPVWLAEAAQLSESPSLIVIVTPLEAVKPSEAAVVEYE